MISRRTNEVEIEAKRDWDGVKWGEPLGRGSSLKIATTRRARPSDGAELECMRPSEFHKQRFNGQIILPQLYNRNKKWYGIKSKSLEKIHKINLVGHIYPDWKIINELRKKYNVVAIFLSAEMNILKKRLLKRIDGHKEKKECLEYIPMQLRKYEKK